MKNLFFLFLLFASITVAQAQYKPLPMQNAEWYQDGGIALLSCPSCTLVNYKYYTHSESFSMFRSYTHKGS
jgi:hypothetical protein